MEHTAHTTRQIVASSQKAVALHKPTSSNYVSDFCVAHNFQLAWSRKESNCDEWLFVGRKLTAGASGSFVAATNGCLEAGN